eukprot:SAG11_NODE_1906_length_4084_cov_31.351568_4_plen_125_part_00
MVLLLLLLCACSELQVSALRLLLGGTDAAQFGRRVSRLADVAAHNDAGWLSPTSRDKLQGAVAGIWQFCHDCGIFSDDEDGSGSDNGSSVDGGDGEMDGALFDDDDGHEDTDYARPLSPTRTKI